jgi:hypothetical protein
MIPPKKTNRVLTLQKGRKKIEQSKQEYVDRVEKEGAQMPRWRWVIGEWWSGES